MPVLQHGHHRLVTHEVRVPQGSTAPWRCQAPRERDGRGQPAIESAPRPEMDRVRRVAEQEAERPWRARRPRMQLDRETRPLHHIQPEGRDCGQVLRRYAEQPQSFLYPHPEGRSLQQGWQKERVMNGTVEFVTRVPFHQAGPGLQALREYLPDRVDPDGFLSLQIGQPHVQEAFAAQRVQQESVLGHGQQYGHGVGKLGLHPQAENHILDLLAIEPVHGRVRGAELGGEVLERARAAAFADGEHALSGKIIFGRSRIEKLGHELDVVVLAVGDGKQLIFDVGDPYIARPEILDRIGALGPHLGVSAGDEQALLNLGR